MSYLLRLFGMQGKKALQTVTDAVAAADPTTASAAQLQEMEADLDKTGRLLAKLRQDAQREDREAVDAKKIFDLNVAAAERLHAQLKEPGIDPERLASLNTSLGALLDQLTSYKNDWDREQQEADEAHQVLTEAEQAYAEKAEALKRAKGQLETSARELERSKLRKEQAEARAETAAELAGLREGTGTQLNSALNALQRQAQSNNQAAEAASLKAQALRKPLLGSSDDPNIAAALKAVENRSADSSLSVDERLAALTGKPITPALSAPKQESTGASA